MLAPKFEVAGHTIAAGSPCFVIAEAGVNHNGDVKLAHKLIDVAAEARADAVKFQTFKAERLALQSAPKAAYQQRTTDAAESQFDMLKRLELPESAYPELIAHAREKGILFLSTPFDEESADFLARLGLPAFKVPSGEITNHPFLAHVAKIGRPMIVSSGMASLGEVEQAVQAISSTGNNRLALLHCVSNYPAAPEDVNLRAMLTMAAAFGAPVGYSDHTMGLEVSLAAAALGATVIEKHFTLDRKMPGPDHLASLEPGELTSLMKGIRVVQSALGDGRKVAAASELETAKVARRSLVAASEIKAGSTLSEKSIAIRRPGTGLPPSLRPHLVGRTAKVTIPAGTLLQWEMLA